MSFNLTHVPNTLRVIFNALLLHPYIYVHIIHSKVESLLEATRIYTYILLTPIYSHSYVHTPACHSACSHYPLHLVVLYVSKSREIEIIMERRIVAVVVVAVVARQRRCKRARNRIAKKISCKSVNTKIILN